MRIATTFAEVDRICDYIPFVSTVSNIVDLFQKCVYKHLPQNLSQNRYWTHIKWKDVSRCLILLIPVLGNIYIALSDYSEYQSDKDQCKKSIQNRANLQSSLAGVLARFSSLVNGQNVPMEQMMPAPTEDQQRLWAACLGNDEQAIRDLLQKGISPNFTHTGNTPLVTACAHSSTQIVRLLIGAGADVNAPGSMGMTPFAAACTKGDLDTVRLLLPSVDIDAPATKGATPLMFAAAEGHREIVEFLLQQGADPKKKDADNNGDAATNAMFLKDRADLLPLLFLEDEQVDERRYHIQIPNDHFFSLCLPTRIYNLTPLLYASIVGSENSAIYLVERSDVQKVDSVNNNALHYASTHMPLLKALLQKCKEPAFINQQNIAGSTALHQAIRLNQPEAALLLLQHGADPLLSNNDGKTALLLACEKDLEPVVQYIQQHHAERISEEIREQAAAATQAAIARRAQVAVQAPAERSSGPLDLLGSSLKLLQSTLERGAERDKQEEELGPLPRTGMELLFGAIPWPK